MLISHICQRCGYDLNRQCAQPDPYYNLPLVTCPRCENSVVRITHPFKSRWRAYIRLNVTVQRIVTRLMLSIILTVFMSFMCILISYNPLNFPIDAHHKNDLYTLLIVASILLPLLTGLCLTASYNHWHKSTLWLTFFVLQIFILSVDTLILPMIGITFNKMGMPLENIPLNLHMLSMRLLILSAFMITATIGILPGKLALKFHQRFCQFRWRAKYRRYKLKRQV